MPQTDRHQVLQTHSQMELAYALTEQLSLYESITALLYNRTTVLQGASSLQRSDTASSEGSYHCICTIRLYTPVTVRPYDCRVLPPCRGQTQPAVTGRTIATWKGTPLWALPASWPLKSWNKKGNLPTA